MSKPDCAVNEKLLNICRAMAQANILDNAYLAGGTALAMQIKHRISVDLDFFLLKGSVLKPEKIHRKTETVFGIGTVAVDFRSGDQLDLIIDGVKVSFIAYPFGLAEPLVAGAQVSDRLSGLFLASPPEIALMKAYALGRRAAFRDYIDLYVLLKDGYASLDYIHKKANQKFTMQGETAFSMKLLLQQLAYTADAGSAEEKEGAVSMMLATRPSCEDIESYLAKTAKEFTLRVLARGAQGGLKL